MTTAHGEMAGGRGGDREGLLPPDPSARMKAVSATIPVRRRADGARKDLKSPLEPLTDLRDEGILAFNAPGPPWEYPIWKMSDNIYGSFFEVNHDYTKRFAA